MSNSYPIPEPAPFDAIGGRGQPDPQHSTVIRTSDPADLIRLAPRLVGMPALQRSVVLIAFGGRRSLGALRVDLPARRGPEVERAFANALLGLLCRIDGADGVAIVVFTEQALPGGRRPHATLIRALRRRLAGAGFHLVHALVVAADGWASYLHPSAAVRPLDELEQSDPAPEVPPPPNSTAELDFARLVPEAEWTAFAALRAPWRARDGRAIDELVAQGRLGAHIEAALAAPRDPGESQALISAIVHRPVLRDVLLLQAGWGPNFGREALQRTLENPDALDDDDPIGLAFCGRYPVRPTVGRLVAATQLLHAIGCRVDQGERADLLAMNAWLYWALGRATHASLSARRALEIDPKQGLAALLQTIVTLGRLPDWAFLPDGDVGRGTAHAG